MPAYVTLPGTSGNYFSTPDVNELPADDAHFQQSKAHWRNQQATDGGTLTADATSVFGDNILRFICDGTNVAFVNSGAANVANIAIAPNTEYTFSLWMRSSDTLEARLAIQSWTAVPGFLSQDQGSWTDITDGDWTQISVTGTSDASAALAILVIEVRQQDSSNPANGDIFDISAACLRTGADGTFVPSLRIVNDLEIEWKVALDDYTPTATNTILDCLSTNDGYRIRHTTGDLIEIAYGNGSSTRAQTSSATGLTDGEEHVFKVTVDQSTGAVVYYIDGVQHDTDTMTTGQGASDINDLVVGANAAASANWTDGDIYYVIVRDGIDGLVVARFDADDWVGV